LKFLDPGISFPNELLNYFSWRQKYQILALLLSSMQKQFTYEIQDDVEDRLKQVQTEVAKRGIEFQGDTKEGKFSGHICGKYTIEGNRMIVTVTSKPLLATWKNVDSRLKNLLED
jgi:hypothetical protein